MLKSICSFSLVAVFAINLAGCGTPEERHKRQVQRDREDAKWDAERRRDDSRRDADDYQDYLAGYARSLGKRTSELTASERAQARREYNDGGYRHGYYGPRMWW